MSPSIQETKQQHEAELLALPGVVSVGIGRNEVGTPAIIIGLDRSRPGTEARIPKTLVDHPVIVQIIGPIRTQ